MGQGSTICASDSCSRLILNWDSECISEEGLPFFVSLGLMEEVACALGCSDYAGKPTSHTHTFPFYHLSLSPTLNKPHTHTFILSYFIEPLGVGIFNRTIGAHARIGHLPSPRSNALNGTPKGMISFPATWEPSRAPKPRLFAARWSSAGGL